MSSRPPAADGVAAGSEPTREAVGGIPASDEADVWLAGMMYCATRKASCLALLNGDDIEAGPVCKLWLKNAIQHGLHGCYISDVFGLQ